MPTEDRRTVLLKELARASRDMAGGSDAFAAGVISAAYLTPLVDDLMDAMFRLQCAAVALDGLRKEGTDHV